MAIWVQLVYFIQFKSNQIDLDLKKLIHLIIEWIRFLLSNKQIEFEFEVTNTFICLEFI